ncbi:hypothetical protein M427DRAFT_353690 [Gonapodya prolifera JEL478]|uniref:Uncharacterized protein n=1 Tax=Gonapodya prolifera (strain JEL478) TaxID=1344416 RepID=A0A139AC69_GONPJ|nr:hypothetical protein M427DRAFT_353690 [Gonapodya prolifera JEL478]|eukprot:KXS14328.1 hypothetical protein M427DRAFT_353690 [Gonapodya prolifera JEL478]
MEVEENIAFNFKLNGSDPPPHLRHTWGERLDEVDSFLDQHGPFDVIIASDILLYTKHYPALLATLEHIMGPHDDSTGPGSDTEPVPEGQGKAGRPSVLLMSWKRRILEGEGENFFAMAERSGKFRVKEAGSKIFEITRIS